MLTMRNNTRGFTLIELLTGLVIIAILFSVAAPNFTIWIQNSQLRTAAESISAGMQLARTEAVQRNASVQFSLTGTAGVSSTWTVGCVAVTADCPATIQSRSGSEGTSNAVVNADVSTVSFNGMGRASNAMTISITNTTGGTCQANGGPMRCLDVRVSPGGQIRMCNPAISVNTNPQGC